MNVSCFNLVNIILVAMLLSSMFFVALTSSVGEYDPLLDINGDGKVDMRDISAVARAFGTSGTPISRTPILNGGFETGTFASWWVGPNSLDYCAYIRDTLVHSGQYSAYISDERHYYNWIRQDVYPRVRLPADSNITLEGWVYPSKVGLLPAENPYSGLILRFYNESSMQGFYILYAWSLSSSVVGHGNFFLPGWNASQWNFLHRNVTDDIGLCFPGIDLSNIMLYSVEAQYHYSNVSPGPFYVDDLNIST